MDDRQRKDRLIQTRVPQDLESTLKDEARKRRLSVSHLIRNVLEDTFSLVDNVVHEVDRVVTDSVEMAQTLKRDAQRLAATARGETAHRERNHGAPWSSARTSEGIAEAELVEPSAGRNASQARGDERSRAVPRPGEEGGERGTADLNSGALADVYGFQELVLNRSATCARCDTTIQRGARAFLGMSDTPGTPRVWVCQPCLQTISDSEL